MLALIMAGGEGTRLGMGEKPLVIVHGAPMIDHVIAAFQGACIEPVVVLSWMTPYLQNWCRAQGVLFIRTAGRGYVDDLIEAVIALEEEGPLFTCAADLPFLDKALITTIYKRYQAAGTDACSTWVPRELVRGARCRESYVEVVDGIPACPAGVNILLGAHIEKPQSEVKVLIHDPRLTFNVNTREDLASANDLEIGHLKAPNSEVRN
jgi:adenosylcobinamide-phosphate guanylyltransferase